MEALCLDPGLPQHESPSGHCLGCMGRDEPHRHANRVHVSWEGKAIQEMSLGDNRGPAALKGTLWK